MQKHNIVNLLENGYSMTGRNFCSLWSGTAAQQARKFLPVTRVYILYL